MKNKSKKIRHFDRLYPSIPDTIALAEAVESRFLDLCAAYRRIRGVDLAIPKELDGDMLRWRQLRVRHKQNDFRNTEAELEATKEIATWTVQVNSALRNQGPKHIVWREDVLDF